MTFVNLQWSYMIMVEEATTKQYVSLLDECFSLDCSLTFRVTWTLNISQSPNNKVNQNWGHASWKFWMEWTGKRVSTASGLKRKHSARSNIYFVYRCFRYQHAWPGISISQSRRSLRLLQRVRAAYARPFSFLRDRCKGEFRFETNFEEW